MFFSKTKSREVALIVDIGSSVGAVLVSFLKGEAPQILDSKRLEVPKSDQTNSKFALLQTLDLVLKSAYEKHVVVKRVNLFFSSPYISSQTQNIKIEYSEPTNITHKLITQLLHQTETKSTEEKELVESKIIQTKLNGYDCPDPYNKKAQRLEISLYRSTVDKNTLEEIKKLIDKYFHTRDLQISSFSLASYFAISHGFKEESDYLIVDVRGSSTDIFQIENKVPSKCIVFDGGADELVKLTAESSATSAKTASSLLSASLTGKTDENTDIKISAITQSFKNTWTESFKKVLNESRLNPNVIFLVCDSDIESFFEKCLKDVCGENVHLLKYLNFKNYLQKDSISTDEFLALESIFVTMI